MAFTPNFDTLIKAAGEGHGGLEFLSQVSTVTLGPCIFSVDLCRWLVLEFFNLPVVTLFCLSENCFPQSTCGKNLVNKHRVLLKSCHGKPSLAPPTRIGFLKSWLSSTAWRVGLLCLGLIKKATGAWSGFLFSWTAPPSAHCIAMAAGSPNLPFCFLWGSYPLCPLSYFPLQ